jgi:hypothetical protein
MRMASSDSIYMGRDTLSGRMNKSEQIGMLSTMISLAETRASRNTKETAFGFMGIDSHSLVLFAWSSYISRVY